MPVIIPAAVAAAGGIYKLGKGISDTSKAKKLGSAPRPTYGIPQGEYDNLNLLGSRASNGLSASSKQIYLDNADRGLSSSISGILQGGGNPNDISRLYDTYLGGVNNISLANDAKQVENIDNFINARYRQSGYEDKAWQLNTFAPWQDQQRAAAQLKAQGAGEISAGIGTLGSAAMSGYSALSGSADTANVFKSPGQPAAGAPPAGAPSGNPYYSGGNVYGFDISGSLPNTDNPRTALSHLSVGSDPYFGLDMSKMKPNDAMMVQSLLWK